MNLQRVVIAYSGSLASSAAVRWLIDTRHADVVAVIVDVGQTDDLEEVHARAIACGAIRAHVVDRRQVFARDAIVPAVAGSAALDAESMRRLAHPVVAATLVEVAAIEGADAVAHASAQSSLEEHIVRVDSTRPILAPAREWMTSHVDPSDYARVHRLPQGIVRAERHLLIRPVAAVRPASDDAACVTIGFDGGIPASVNGVAMVLQDLIESVSLLGGQYHLGAADAVPPAAIVLRAAYRASRERDSVTLRLQAGSLVVVEAGEPRSVLVNQS